MKFPLYLENERYLKNEFTNCSWDQSTGMEPEVLERQLTALWKNHGAESAILAKSRIYRYLIQNARIELNPKNLFPGKIDNGVKYSETGVDEGGMYARLFFSIREETLKKELPEVHSFREYASGSGLATCETDFWHNMPDLQALLDLGFSGLRARAEKERDDKMARMELSRDQEEFYQGVLICLDAIDIYMERMIAYAGRFKEAELYVECMKHIRRHAPETLYQAMMISLVYIQLEELGVERCRTLGIIDRMYYPFYCHDIQKGILTQDDVKELFRYFFGRWSRAGRFAAQPFTICGVDENGKDAGNELTDLILTVYDEMDILNPKIHVRWHKDFSPVRLRKLLEMIRHGHSAILFVNDETVYRAYEKIGISRDVSQNYVPFGCYEPTLMGLEDAMIGASWLNIAKSVEYCMNDGRDMSLDWETGVRTGLKFDDFDAFYQAFLKQLDAVVEKVIDGIEKQNVIAMKINPSPVYSATIKSCMEKGKDVFDNGMVFNNISVKCFGIGTAVDSLAAVKELVFEKKEVGFDEMRKALLNNWKGYETLRVKALNLKQKFGNNEPVTNKLAHDIYKHLTGLYVGRACGRGGVYRMGGDSITYCILFGKGLAATPDGRSAGAVVSKNFSGTAGMEKNGLSANMLSILSMDQSDFCDAGVFDFVAHPSMLEGEKGLDAMECLLRVYFDRGGFAMHGNVLQIDALKDAQIHPENYPDLQVRLCGWNEYFVTMNTESQNAFIRRLEVQ